jgi:HSP20 family protein
MNIIPRKPFSRELDNFFGEDDWFFPVFPTRGSFDPDMDVYETDKDVVAKIVLPDISCDDVKVSVEENVLKISGDFEEKKEEKEKNYWRKEIRSGSFQRAVRLPSEVDGEKSEATYEKGVLTIVLPKIKPKKKEEKEIKIKTN